jgi:hypothetical protein
MVIGCGIMVGLVVCQRLVFGKLVVKAMDRMENIASDAEPITYCG